MTELLVASVLVGIVMLGIVSFSVAIRQMHGATSKTVILSMRAKAALAQMADDAILAVGDQTNRGVVVRDTGALGRSICFRHASGDIALYNDDIWVCYYKEHGNDKLWHCDEPTPSAQVPLGSLNNCGSTPGRKYLLDLNDSTFANFFNVQNDASGRLNYIELIVDGVYDRTKTIHPIENPEITVTTRVSPPGHSR